MIGVGTAATDSGSRRLQPTPSQNAALLAALLTNFGVLASM